jgi:hypothetical protein
VRDLAKGGSRSRNWRNLSKVARNAKAIEVREP